MEQPVIFTESETYMVNQTAVKLASWQYVFSAWLVAAVATVGSLFFSEVMELAPCLLCWYQRIFMFPLAVILLAGLHPLDIRVVRYALPLAVISTPAAAQTSAPAAAPATAPSAAPMAAPAPKTMASKTKHAKSRVKHKMKHAKAKAKAI